jgi:hypothetical protein
MITYQKDDFKQEYRGDRAVVVRQDNAGFFGQLRQAQRDPLGISPCVADEEDHPESPIRRKYIGIDRETAELLLDKLRKKQTPEQLDTMLLMD